MYHDYSNFKHCVDVCCSYIDSFLWKIVQATWKNRKNNLHYNHISRFIITSVLSYFRSWINNNERSMDHDYSNFKHCVDGCCACIDSFLWKIVQATWKNRKNNLHYNHISRCFVNAALSYFKNTGICLSCILFFSIKRALIKTNNKNTPS